MFASCLSSASAEDVGVVFQHLQLASRVVRANQFEFTDRAKQYCVTKRMLERDIPEQLRPIAFDANEILRGKLWLGGVGAAQNSGKLRANGIKFVLTVADGCLEMRAAATAKGGAKTWRQGNGILDHAHIDVTDFPQSNLALFFDEAIEWMDRVMRRGALLVHCVQGVSRSVTIVVAYLMARREMRLQEALDFVRERRAAAKPNYGFLAQLSRYEDRLYPPKLVHQRGDAEAEMEME